MENFGSAWDYGKKDFGTRIRFILPTILSAFVALGYASYGEWTWASVMLFCLAVWWWGLTSKWSRKGVYAQRYWWVDKPKFRAFVAVFYGQPLADALEDAAFLMVAKERQAMNGGK